MTARRRVVRWLRALGIAGIADHAQGALAAWNVRHENAAYRAANPGRPAPDPRLIYEIQTYASLAQFDRSGRAHARAIADVLAPLPPAPRILEWGCGPARILAPLGEIVPDAVLSGCDPMRRAIAWATKAHPTISFTTIAPQPPTSYVAAGFDAIYGVSILTHLDAAQHHVWAREITRLLAPTGVAALSLHTAASAIAAIRPQDRARYDAGEIVTYGGAERGSRVFAAYVSPDGARKLFSPHFSSIVHLPDVAGVLGQDIWLLRGPIR